MAASLGYMALYFMGEGDRTRARFRSDLAEATSIKATRVAAWRRELADQAVRAAADATVVAALSAPAGPAERDIPTELPAMREVANRCGAQEAILTDRAGMSLLSSVRSGALGASPLAVAGRASSTSRPSVSDLFIAPGGEVCIDSAAPVQSKDQRVLGVIVLRSLASTSLYPVLGTKQVGAKTGETMLVRKHNGGALVMNNLRQRERAGMRLVIRGNRIGDPAVHAILGRTGPFTGTDYAGASVEAHIAAVPESAWFVVDKLDTDEIAAEVSRRVDQRFRVALVVMLVLTLVVLATFAMLLASGARRAATLRRFVELERAKRESEASFGATLYSLSDGVIATDCRGIVRSVNPAAERLTGWHEAEAVGRHVDDVVRLLDGSLGPAVTNLEQTRHATAVVRRDGVELMPRGAPDGENDRSATPVSLSCSSIDGDDGRMLGTVVVLSDRTVERHAERALRASEERFKRVAGTMADFAYSCCSVETQPDPAAETGEGEQTGGRGSRRGMSCFEIDWLAGDVERVTGHSREELTDAGCWGVLVVPEDRPVFEQSVVGLAPGQAARCDLRIRRKDGTVRWLHVSTECAAGPTVSDGRGESRSAPRRLYGGCTDITESRNADEARHAVAERAVRQADTIRRLAGSSHVAAGDLVGAVHDLVEHIAHTFLIDRVGVWLFDRGQTVLTSLEMYDRQARAHLQTQTLGRDTIEGEHRDLADRGYVDANDAGSDPRTAPARAAYLDPAGVQSLLDGAIRTGGRVLGVLRLEQVGHARTWEPDEIAFACQAADQLGLAILNAERREAQEQVRRLNDALRAAGDVLERRVQERTSELQSAIEDVESFSYTVSHDLRAPLRAINGYAALLADEIGPTLDDDNRRLLGSIRASAVKMGRLIDDLLGFSRASRRQIRRQETDPEDLVREVLTDFARDIAAHQVTVSVGPLPACHADPGLIRQVFQNLISNGIKYARNEERPTVEVSSLRTGPDVVYFVRDNGVGFDMKYHDRIFGVFQRLHTEAEFEGTGIGLANVHRIVSRHGGRVWANSSPGEGSTFYFTIGDEDTETPHQGSGPHYRMGGHNARDAYLTD
jgi:PAS domain S-box-containing protein